MSANLKDDILKAVAYSKMLEHEKSDRRTALKVLQDLSAHMRPNLDLFGNKILFIRRDEFEKIRKKYLDVKE